ncbi:hypothetical protein BR93DRAFT_971412 [Coniochaeta sp. PMI_546]|nr:hypothetical protein BR93DRAFT_971412 [Coniochaeta sp. PMI_546]
MAEHGSDEKVQAMCKYVFGENDFNNKFDQVKAIFDAIRVYSRDPSPFRPQDDAWKAIRSNEDVEVYCDASRIINRGTETKGNMWDTMMQRAFRVEWYEKLMVCYNPSTVPKTGTAMAFTWNSDFTRLWDWIQAGGNRLGIPKADYTTPTRYASSMDLCTWYTNQKAAEGWPKIDSTTLETVKSEDFINALKELQTPVDGLRYLGATFLHELTHTPQGGRLEDVTDNNLPDGTRQCYGWRCVGQLKNVRNSDSINMLAIALKVWSLKHWVNDDGQIIPL